jgi:hypothetical protein
LFNGKLSNFDLGQKLSTVAALAGIKTGKDLDIEKFTADAHMSPTGLKADNIDLVVPSLGTVVGNGTVDAKNNMDFKLVATVTAEVANSAGNALNNVASAEIGKFLGGGSNCKGGALKVPLQVRGTTANPQFTPDVGGVAAGMLKSQLACAGGAAPAGTPGGTSGNVINQLGGLLGSKKPKQ